MYIDLLYNELILCTCTCSHCSCLHCFIVILYTDNISLTTPTSKPKTTKQRLGKLLGLDRSGHFLRK